MYENIVLTLDGSELSETALPYAEELLGRLGCRVILLHVCDPAKRDERRKYFSSLEKRLESNAKRSGHCDGLEAKTIFLEGNPVEAITDFIQRYSIDLTIMATHGRSGVSRWAMGSVADKVLRGVTRPVALIRAGLSRQEKCFSGGKLFGRILAPVDGSTTGDAALPYVRDLALKMQSEVVLFHSVLDGKHAEDINWIDLRGLTNTGARSCLVNAGQWLKSAGVDVTYRVKFGDPAEQIIETARITGSDMIAMCTHGRSGMDRMVFGSVAEKVLQRGDIPLLLVRAKSNTD